MTGWWCAKHFAEMGVYVAIVEAILNGVQLEITRVIFYLAAVIFWIGVRYLVRNRPSCGADECSACKEKDLEDA